MLKGTPPTTETKQRRKRTREEHGRRLHVTGCIRRMSYYKESITHNLTWFHCDGKQQKHKEIRRMSTQKEEKKREKHRKSENSLIACPDKTAAFT